MKKTSALLLTGSVVTLIVAGAFIGCASQNEVDRRFESVSRDPAAENGRGINSTYGLGSAAPGKPDYDRAPEFDLQSVLTSSGQGGADASPFRFSPIDGAVDGRMQGHSTNANGLIVRSTNQETRRFFSPEPGAYALKPPGTPRAVDGVGVLEGPWAAVLADPGAVEPSRLASVSTDELWIIQKPNARTTTHSDDTPGSGCLMTQLPGQERQVPVPLKHTEVSAAITGYISTVDVTQQFHNPYDSKIEAVYVFPLPENAAVNEFLMTIGDRTIRGIIREREEAQQIYTQARAQGHNAALMTQERPNVFTQHVANIEPGKAIDIQIRYYHTLAYHDGAYEFTFPMVVGPRFNPPGTTEGVGAVGRGDAGVSGQKTEVEYLRPGERSGHDIAVTVDIDAGVSIEKIDSRSHVVEARQQSGNRAQVRLCASDTIPNKDFVLRYQVAGKTVKSALLTHRDHRGGFFTLMIVPPADLESTSRGPVEMVFVLDSSGSMSGEPIAQAKAAIERGIKRLDADDTFQLINFYDSSSQLGSQPLAATPDNIRKGLAYLDQISAGGGTMMIHGIRGALDFPHDESRLRFVSFLTDGYIGNEAEILGEMRTRLGESRVFSFGVGSSVNRYLMDSMARIGRGAVSYLGRGDSANEVMDLFFDRISHAALSDIRIDFGDARVSEVYPSRAPDLFVGRPVIITGRFDGDFSGDIRVTGRAGGEARHMLVSTRTEESVAPISRFALPSVWARAKISDLSDQMTWNANPELTEAVRQVALDYSLMSSFTSFVAVDSSVITAGTFGTTVNVPVPVPEGVKYETTVPGAK